MYTMENVVTRFTYSETRKWLTPKASAKLAIYLLKNCWVIAIWILVLWPLAAKAQNKLPKLVNSKIVVNYTAAYTAEDERFSLSRFTADWSGKLHISSSWNAQIELSAQLANDDVGLGSTDNFARFNNPLIDDEHARLAVNQLSLTWRKGKNTVDIGKQFIPWGVLDGIQVSDRFDPVRRRDFVFAEYKPERLARWGLRWRTKLVNWRVDTAFVFDGTVSQQANFGDEFQLTAPRYLAGLNLSKLGSNTNIMINGEERDHSVSQSTLGMRLSRHIGSGELSLLGFRGPDTEPVLSLTSPLNQTLSLNLHYPRRNVLAVNYDFSHGPAVWRIEGAYIPDQGLNIKSQQLTTISQGARSLLGFGLDWQSKQQIFINAQIVVDYIDLPEQLLFRPKTDSILTLRIQRPFYNQRLLIKSELIGSLNQEDGIIRPSFIFELTDNMTLKGGVDWAFGDTNGQFGQFKDASRLWLGFRYSL